MTSQQRTIDTSLFGMDLKRTLTPWHHIAVTSGWGVVQPLMPTVCGVGSIFCPPLLARDFLMRLQFRMEGGIIVDDGNYGKGDCGVLYAGGNWYPDHLERHGTYHHRVKGRLRSFEVRSELTPLWGRAGFLLNVRIRNRGEGPARIEVVPDLSGGHPARVELNQWDYCIPQAGVDAATRVAPLKWSNGRVAVTLLHEGLKVRVNRGSEQEITLACVVHDADQSPEAPGSLAQWREETRQAWARRLRRAGERMPLLQSDIPGLQDYYHRSLVSGLVCVWERPDFISNPFVTTSGMDGGAICCYPWDTGGYASHTIMLLLGDRMRDIIRFQTSSRLLEKHSRYTPDGTPTSVPYAYNMCSLVSLVHASACHHGIDPAIYAKARDSMLAIESRQACQGDLLDWGVQHNLLEMRQTGWEHIVVSPNAERAWCFERMAEIGERIGDAASRGWRRKAQAIRRAIRKELWDSRSGWFVCRFPDGHVEKVYSIQVFDAVQAGACTKAMADRVFAHVREGAFLGEYGVSSVSAEDHEHYELNDPDWSGGGAYSGDGPALALTLWEAGRHEQAWDVFRRFFWMGRHLLYFPQEHYCDRPSVVPHKRANVVAGLTGVETVIRGLFGLRFNVDGSVVWNPAPRREGKARLAGLVVHGRSLDLEMNKKGVVARVDGKCVMSGSPRPAVLIPSAGKA